MRIILEEKGNSRKLKRVERADKRDRRTERRRKDASRNRSLWGFA